MDTGSTTPWLTLARNMNADGQLTLTDIWLWIVALFFAPGDYVLWAMLTYAPGLAQFLELGPQSYHGLFAAMVSGGIWLVAFVLAGTAYGLVRRLDRALTSAIARVHGECRRRLRVLRIRSLCRLRAIELRLPSRRRRRRAEIDLDELELTALEHEVLRATAMLAPGYVHTASDIAGALEIGRRDAGRTLARLESLKLLETALSASDGESGYRLSSSGRFLLGSREPAS